MVNIFPDPQPPISPLTELVNELGTKVSWTPPSSAACISGYEVNYLLLSTFFLYIVLNHYNYNIHSIIY